MPARGKPSSPDPQKLTYEEAVEELESIITRIEEGEIGLEDSLIAYERGVALIKRCRTVLDAAEQRIEQLTIPPEGTAKGG